MDEEMINNLSSMLKNGNIPDNLKDIVSNFSGNSAQNQPNSSSTNIDPNMIASLLSSLNNSSNNTAPSSDTTSNIDMETILKMKTIIDKMNKNQNDPRANLLKSLKHHPAKSGKSDWSDFQPEPESAALSVCCESDLPDGWHARITAYTIRLQTRLRTVSPRDGLWPAYRPFV